MACRHPRDGRARGERSHSRRPAMATNQDREPFARGPRSSFVRTAILIREDRDGPSSPQRWPRVRKAIPPRGPPMATRQDRDPFGLGPRSRVVHPAMASREDRDGLLSMCDGHTPRCDSASLRQRRPRDGIALPTTRARVGHTRGQRSLRSLSVQASSKSVRRIGRDR
jgi:hypothetical protein